MQKKYDIAVVGATGSAGSETLSILAERNFPINKIYALASENSIGRQVNFGNNETLNIESASEFNFDKVQLVFSATSTNIASQIIPKVLKSGATVIDKSSLYRLNKETPLIVPEVNGAEIRNYSNTKLISVPNCCVIPLVSVLKPLDARAKIKRVVMSTYQSTSGAGSAAMDELCNQTAAKLSYQEIVTGNLPRIIAFNVIPEIDGLDNMCNSGEEIKISSETQKILGNHVKLTSTCVRVPVFIGHCLSINLELSQKLSVEDVENILGSEKNLVINSYKSNKSYVTPIEIAGEDSIYVGRIREDLSQPNTFNLWIVTDNLRRGAALTAVQIAELLITKYI